MKRVLVSLLGLAWVTLVAAGAEIRVATLNCLLLFDPAIEHRGKVDDEQRMTVAQYQEKLGNLTSLIKGYQIVGLQETGGRAEVTALAKRAGMSWCWVRGNDTATGEEVGLLHSLSGWKVTTKGRVPLLDWIVSKHLLVEATNGGAHVYFLVIHLLRPMGTQVAKHETQRKAIGEWLVSVSAREPQSTVVVLGDTNSALTEISLFGTGVDAGAQIGFQPTHLTKKAYDRLVLSGPGSWESVEVRKPPYGNRPAAAVKRVWTDHYLLGATLKLP